MTDLLLMHLSFLSIHKVINSTWKELSPKGDNKMGGPF